VRGLTSYPNPLLRSWRLVGGVHKPNLFYRGVRRLLQVTFSAFWKIRVFDRRHEPTAGGVAYVCNHQSFLDPMVMSLALRRPMNYMARDNLFHPPLKWIVEALNAFPVRRGTADISAIKEAMRRIKAGGQVVVFAEGTRTPDGRIGRMLPGVAMLAQRAADWTVPVLIDGAYEAWPRTQWLPGPGRIVVRYAPPIPRAQAEPLAPQELVDHIRSVLIDLQADTRRRLGRPALPYDTTDLTAPPRARSRQP